MTFLGISTVIVDGAFEGVFVWNNWVNRIPGAKEESGVETPFEKVAPPVGVDDVPGESGTPPTVPPQPPPPAPIWTTGGTVTAREVSSSNVEMIPDQMRRAHERTLL